MQGLGAETWSDTRPNGASRTNVREGTAERTLWLALVEPPCFGKNYDNSTLLARPVPSGQYIEGNNFVLHQTLFFILDFCLYS